MIHTSLKQKRKINSKRKCNIWTPILHNAPTWKQGIATDEKQWVLKPSQPGRTQVSTIFPVMYSKIHLCKSCNCNKECPDHLSMYHSRCHMDKNYLPLHFVFPKKWHSHIAFDMWLVVCNSQPSKMATYKIS